MKGHLLPYKKELKNICQKVTRFIGEEDMLVEDVSIGSHGIELTFLKLYSWSLGAGFYNLQWLKLDKERKNERRIRIQKISNVVFKNGFNPVLVQFLDNRKYHVNITYELNKLLYDKQCWFFIKISL